MHIELYHLMIFKLSFLGRYMWLVREKEECKKEFFCINYRNIYFKYKHASNEASMKI